MVFISFFLFNAGVVCRVIVLRVRFVLLLCVGTLKGVVSGNLFFVVSVSGLFCFIYTTFCSLLTTY